jgi:hypothetical protein
VSLILKMRDFAFAQTEGFSNQVASRAGVHHPRKENGKLDGRWLFSVDGANLSGIEHSKSLATWEKLVQELASKPEFANEGYYWTVVGVEPIAQLGTDYSDSVTWPTALRHRQRLHFKRHRSSLSRAVGVSTTSPQRRFGSILVMT